MLKENYNWVFEFIYYKLERYKEENHSANVLNLAMFIFLHLFF